MVRNIAMLFFLLYTTTSLHAQAIRVGAKHFNEGYILSEMIALILEDGGFDVERKFNLGGTAVSFEALRNRSIDVYPEYTGTIATEILKSDVVPDAATLNGRLDAMQLLISAPYGFNNSYALLMDSSLSKRYDIRKISDLVNLPELKVGLSYEFLKRNDGWTNLAIRYALPQQPTALEHGLAYQAIMDRKIDLTDAYSTDGEIKKYNLVLLVDDFHFFPEYQAVSFYVHELPEEAKILLQKLDGAISQVEMQRLNAQALFENTDHRKIAVDFLMQKKLIKDKEYGSRTVLRDILEKTWVHLTLTLLALCCAILVAVPLGLVIYRYPVASNTLLYFTGILQTIPSIALLALMIPIMGIGMLPAVIALFLYALLPILRNTVMGLANVDPVLKQVATGIGLNSWNKLRLVELPLAMPMILAGIRTAAVINIGTATLAAFIGAGGLGEFIVTGLALNNTTLILQGAIPSALLAILMELVFEGIEWFVVPQHLQRQRTSSGV
jgi:osmoprotectant transport system permease protein